jgi:hypothetical protein
MSNAKIVDGNLILRGITWIPCNVSIAVSANNLAIDSSIVLVKPSANISITGFDASAVFGEVKEGTMIWLRNKSPTFSITLAHDTTSTVGNRVYTPSGSDYVVTPKSQSFLMYDSDENDGNPGWWVFA